MTKSHCHRLGRLPIAQWAILAALLAATPLSADQNASPVEVTSERQGDKQYRLVAKNSTHSDITLIVTLTLTNMVSSAGQPVLVNLSPRSEAVVSVLSQKTKNQEFRFRYNHNWYWGRLNAKHDDSFVYQLPFAAGGSFHVGQAYNGSRGGVATTTHKGWCRYAVDFRMPEGTPIHAAREGIVVDVVEKYSEGGTSADYSGKGNHIRIMHDDGTIGFYNHLMKDGSEVKGGDKVKQGQRIGLSGNTGRSWRPHLHFHVRRMDRRGEKTTVPTWFLTTGGRERLQGYTTYTRPQLATQPRAPERRRREVHPIEAAKWRTWATADGKHKVEAKFITYVGGTVILEKKDGTTVDVQLDILCPEDQEYVKNRGRRGAASKE